MKLLLSLILVLSFFLPARAAETDGSDYLKRGKEQLESKMFEDAIASLSKSAKEFPMLGDYALLWLSDAYHETGNHDESLKTIRSLIKKYPGSALERKARIREIKEAGEVAEDDTRRLFKSYTKDYPGDMEMKYLYGAWLKKNGEGEQARKMFKEIYINGNSFSGLAASEVDPSDISVEDLLKRASNLTSAMDYKGAESVLRTALSRDDGTLKRRILSGLGNALFKQKRYSEAADTFKLANDIYWEMRSRYRAREKDIFETSTDDLLKVEDRRMASILVAVASDWRRAGKTEQAINLLQKVIENYPSEKEDALWGIAWTYFQSREYKKASEVFTKLYDLYEDTQYLYWKGRCLEATGEDSSEIFSRVLQKKRDFYSVIARRKAVSEKSGDCEGYPSRDKDKRLTPVRNFVKKRIERVDSLVELGFVKEAVSEIIFDAKKTSSLEDMAYMCLKLQELGQYQYSVRLAAKAQGSHELAQFLYPLAHWDIVQGFSKKYGIDPFLALAIVREESRFDADARSSAGAMGLMQLMPPTAYRFDRKLKLGIKSTRDILDVKNNLNVGILYLAGLVRDFDSYAPAIASYNAGEDVVKKWLKAGHYKSADEFIEDIPYLETRNYVKRVLTSFYEYKRLFSSDDVKTDIPIEKL